jgi:hypothetical protein
MGWITLSAARTATAALLAICIVMVATHATKPSQWHPLIMSSSTSSAVRRDHQLKDVLPHRIWEMSLDVSGAPLPAWCRLRAAPTSTLNGPTPKVGKLDSLSLVVDYLSAVWIAATSQGLNADPTEQTEEPSVGLQRIKCRFDGNFRHRELALREGKFQRSDCSIVFAQSRV